MTTEEQYDELLRLNRENNEAYDRECEKNAEHRAYVRAECPTLRDDFAKAALQGMAVGYLEHDMDAAWFADRAYDMADAMLAARSKK